MTQDNPSSAVGPGEAGGASRELPALLRMALWASPLIVVSGYVLQAIFRFPHLSRGAGLTALALVLGLVLGGTTALFGLYQLIRRPYAWTKTARALLAVNTVFLLGAIAVVPNLLA